MAGETVTRIRETVTGEDRYHNPTTTDVETSIEGAFFAPAGSPELVASDRVTVSEAPTVYWLKEWPDVIATDRLRVRGVVYRVDGNPLDWRDPWGTTEGGLVVKLAL